MQALPPKVGPPSWSPAPRNRDREPISTHPSAPTPPPALGGVASSRRGPHPVAKGAGRSRDTSDPPPISRLRTDHYWGAGRLTPLPHPGARRPRRSGANGRRGSRNGGKVLGPRARTHKHTHTRARAARGKKPVSLNTSRRLQSNNDKDNKRATVTHAHTHTHRSSERAGVKCIWDTI